MTQDPVTLWQLIPLQEFKAPVEPASVAVRSGLLGFWRQLRRPESPAPSPEDLPQAELKAAPMRLLDWAAPSPDWSKAPLPGLDGALQTWLDADLPGVQLVVDAPVGALDAALRAWGLQHRVRIVEPPSAEQILAGDKGWLASWREASQQPCLLPGLEYCFLRHHQGLDLVRRLLEDLWRRRPPCVVLCSSWAWRYLCQVVGAHDLLPPPLTLAPFDEESLLAWFSEMAASSSHFSFTFRKADNGKAVLGAVSQPEVARLGRSTFLKELAVRSRGNPRVAWEMWRRSLLISGGEEVDDRVLEAAAEDEGFTIWIQPWEKVRLPEIGPAAPPVDGFVLHTLLLHGHADCSLLKMLLPSMAHEVVASLARLDKADLIESIDRSWRIRPLAYPAIRKFLRLRGFFDDELP